MCILHSTRQVLLFPYFYNDVTIMSLAAHAHAMGARIVQRRRTRTLRVTYSQILSGKTTDSFFYFYNLLAFFNFRLLSYLQKPKRRKRPRHVLYCIESESGWVITSIMQ